MLIAIGCERQEGQGSAVRFLRDGEVFDVHRPHPNKEAKRYQIRDAKLFLTRLGIKP